MIDILTQSKDMTTIVTEFGKFRYNWLTMGMGDSRNIFQATVDDILGGIEYVKMYINNVLVLIKDYFPKHIDQIRVNIYRIHSIGLKVNMPKYSFGLKVIPYLGYIIT